MAEGKAVAAAAIVVWMFLSGSVIFFNASILQHFRHPVALTCWHSVVSCIFVGCIQVVKPGLLNTGNEEKGIPPLDVRRSVELGVPVALMAALGLVTSNTAYMYLTVSFVQMIKAWTSSGVYIVGCFMGTQTWSVPVSKTLFTITFGLTVASIGELKFNLYGFVLQVISLISEAVRINMLEIRLKSQGYKLNPLSSMKIFAPLIFITLGLCLVVGDKEALDPTVINETGWHIFAINGVIACLLNLSVFFVIQVANGLVYALSGVAKDLMIIAGSALVKGDRISLLQAVGYTLAVLGVQAYTQVSKAPEEFEAGVIPEIFLRLRRCIAGPSDSDTVHLGGKDRTEADQEELRTIVGAADAEEEDEEGQELAARAVGAMEEIEEGQDGQAGRVENDQYQQNGARADTPVELVVEKRTITDDSDLLP